MCDEISFELDAFLSSKELDLVKKYQEVFNNPYVIMGYNPHRRENQLYSFDFDNFQVKNYKLVDEDINPVSENVYVINASSVVQTKQIVNLLNQSIVCSEINILNDYVSFMPRHDDIFRHADLVSIWYQTLASKDHPQYLERLFYNKLAFELRFRSEEKVIDIDFIADDYFVQYRININSQSPIVNYQNIRHDSVRMYHSDKAKIERNYWSMDLATCTNALRETILLFKDDLIDHQINYTDIISGKLPKLPIFQVPDNSVDDYD